MNSGLREARKRNGKTQKEISEQSGISLKSYQRIELGEQTPSVAIAIRIADAVGESVDKLFREEKKGPPSM